MVHKPRRCVGANRAGADKGFRVPRRGGQVDASHFPKFWGLNLLSPGTCLAQTNQGRSRFSHKASAVGGQAPIQQGGRLPMPKNHVATISVRSRPESCLCGRPKGGWGPHQIADKAARRRRLQTNPGPVSHTSSGQRHPDNGSRHGKRAEYTPPTCPDRDGCTTSESS